MSIATEIQRLQQAKADIKAAIEEKGVEVGDGTIDTFASKIAEITGGGGSAEGCVTVTFMNGANVLLTRPVYIGDDCPDPLTQGRIETPTKESTVQYHYTYSGWTSVDGGTADGNVLKNITEDKVVYSAYTESVRTYTVTFYDEDGTTVLNTEQVAYGGTATYTPPKKDGFMFMGWTPEPTNITSDLECIGAWQESYAFADAPWDYIAQVSESGQASEVFAVGDTRTETLTYSDDTTEQITITIIGFDFDTKSDDTGKAGITVISNVLATDQYMSRSYSGDVLYPNTGVYKYLNETVWVALPTVLHTYIKGVDKEYKTAHYGTINQQTITLENEKLWILSTNETCHSNVAMRYPYFEPNIVTSQTLPKNIGYKINGEASNYWLRTGLADGSSWYYVDTLGKPKSDEYPKKCGVRFGFCI